MGKKGKKKGGDNVMPAAEEKIAKQSCDERKTRSQSVNETEILDNKSIPHWAKQLMDEFHKKIDAMTEDNNKSKDKDDRENKKNGETNSEGENSEDEYVLEDELKEKEDIIELMKEKIDLLNHKLEIQEEQKENTEGKNKKLEESLKKMKEKEGGNNIQRIKTQKAQQEQAKNIQRLEKCNAKLKNDSVLHVTQIKTFKDTVQALEERINTLLNEKEILGKKVEEAEVNVNLIAGDENEDQNVENKGESTHNIIEIKKTLAKKIREVKKMQEKEVDMTKEIAELKHEQLDNKNANRHLNEYLDLLKKINKDLEISVAKHGITSQVNHFLNASEMSNSNKTNCDGDDEECYEYVEKDAYYCGDSDLEEDRVDIENRTLKSTKSAGSWSNDEWSVSDTEETSRIVKDLTKVEDKTENNKETKDSGMIVRRRRNKKTEEGEEMEYKSKEKNNSRQPASKVGSSTPKDKRNRLKEKVEEQDSRRENRIKYVKRSERASSSNNKRYLPKTKIPCRYKERCLY